MPQLLLCCMQYHVILDRVIYIWISLQLMARMEAVIAGVAWWRDEMETFTGHRWIPLTKASDAGTWCFLWSAPKPRIEQTMKTPVIWEAIVLINTSLSWTYLLGNTVIDSNYFTHRYWLSLHHQHWGYPFVGKYHLNIISFPISRQST